MNVKLRTGAIKKLVKRMFIMSEDDRFQSYATIKVLTDELLNYAAENEYPEVEILQNIDSLLESCAVLSKIEKQDGCSDEEYVKKVYQSVKILESESCFNVNPA